MYAGNGDYANGFSSPLNAVHFNQNTFSETNIYTTIHPQCECISARSYTLATIVIQLLKMPSVC